MSRTRHTVDQPRSLSLRARGAHDVRIAGAVRRFAGYIFFARRWLRIVVDFNESPGFVVTAFVQDNAPGTKP